MLMKSPTLPNRRSKLAESLHSAICRVSSGAKQLYRAVKHRRDMAALADYDDYLLADIGLTRDDVRYAVVGPFWRDPTATLQRSAGVSRHLSRLEALAATNDPNRCALAELDEGDVSNLSDLGRRTR